MKKNSSRSGISLLEIAIIVTIVGVMGGLAFSVGKTQLDVATIKGSDNNLQNVKNALLLYHKKMGRFPCPANPADTISAASYGVEQTGCEAACPAGIVCSNNTAIGYIPFKALGINDSATLDGWGRRLSYAIDVQHTTSSGFAAGTIPIVDAANNPVTASPTFGSAIFVVLSHGPDGKGAYTESGQLYSACDTTSPSLDAENCNGDDTFRDMRNQDGDTATQYYDDQIVWHTQTDIQESTNENNEVCLSGALSAKTKKFAIGEYNGCYIGNNGQIYCWGSGNYGSLARGAGGIAPAKTPVAITGGINDWISVGVAWRHSCGLRSNGHVYCWGRNWWGQVGDGTSTTPGGPASVGVHTPTEVDGGSCSWTMISTGDMQVCGIKTDGRLYCWGADATSTAQLVPVEITGDHTDWIYVDVHSFGSACGIRGSGSAGSLYCWGGGDGGQLGNGTNTDSAVPVQVKDTAGTGSYNNWVMVNSEAEGGGASGLGTAVCGIRAGGQAYCWGDNTDGKLGINVASGTRNLPVQVRDTAGTGYWSDWTHIKAGKAHTCGVRSNGRGYCWGRNSQGQLGIGSIGADQLTPQEVSGAFTNWASIEPMYAPATCGLRTNNQIYCWGDSWTSGLLGGNQPDNTNYSTPQAVTMTVPMP